MAWQRAQDIGARLKEAREFLGETQEQFGERAGVEGQQVSEWDNRRSKPSRSRLERLAKNLRITVAAFEEGGPRPATLLQRLAGAPIRAEAASGATARDSARASLVRENPVGASQAVYADVRPLRGKRALDELEVRLLELEARGRMPTPAEYQSLLRLAQAARAGDVAAGEGA